MVDFNDFEPVRQAQPASLPAAASPASEPGPAAPVAAPAPVAVVAPRFVGGKPRERVIPLEYPLEFEGRTYASITLRRPTSAEVGAWFEELAERARVDPEGRWFLPIFVDEVGAPIPEAVLDALDGDDDEAVLGAAGDFLPRRLRVLWVDPRPASTPQAGEPTAPTS